MRSLLDFILRIHFLVLFLLIETFSIILLINNNNFQHAGVVNMSRQLSGRYYTRVSNIRQYLSLEEENNKLIEENTRLLNLLESTNKSNEVIYGNVLDTVLNQQYSYISAQIVNNSVNKKHNFLTLNKGLLHGIRPEMAVVSKDGVVGIVKGVSANYSTVISLLNLEYKISAKIKKNNYFGSLSWDGKNYRYATLNEIPLHADIQIGDTIITSGFSSIYPEGIIIGYINDFEEKTGSFYEIKIDLSVDFKNIRNVYVVSNLLQAEQNKIEEQIQ
ncbi:MAG: rod shape-determining protein MreC [Bacteroidetes bacterium GWC2_33_15]|nr:MAG: rod shape-determining protein MreC [Bacteroidetes bacterium GWA2_33_15]OFX51894.1 MAG: rod shape-determining protein MreC [Bacteroidetes bacterium GWC2_33_15]OFX63462.1 MAG: rod shape-determining protein MreC [Bacteroidetes bacterium GWB2_32_14]OFX67189.1 MAG: rod shape-determining protein MreC [Bacteroidetes bacterium GWD2_33_33]HAN17086.1 rod shape-determining protein MreC [Bacteroidales bacterium]